MKTITYRHQKEAIERSRDKPVFAIFDEQGLGKTREILGTVEHLYLKKKIEGLVVIAPNGVHSNWTRQEIPKHLDLPVVVLEWASGKQKTNKFQRRVFEVLAPTFRERRLRVLSFNVEAFSTPGPATDLVKKFLAKYPTLLVVDEASRIKTPSAQRTKRILSLGRSAAYRRILTGTPVTQSPFDLYSQFFFLDPKILGFYSYYSFKHNYGRWEKKVTTVNNRTWDYENLIRYVRLEDLQRRIEPHLIRRTKSECLDLPQKIYKTVGVDLSPAQRKLYDRVMAHGVIELNDLQLLTPLQITRLLRCQQIIGGYLPSEEGESSQPVPGPNPKLELLLSLIEDHPGKLVIWARFRAEIMAIVLKLKENYGHDSVVELHGGVRPGEREKNLARFQNDPTVRFLVGQQQSGIGIDLFAAETVIYYSNTFSYEQRFQTEDRCHRIGLKHPVLYVDLVANDTVDERIAEVLRKATRTAYKLLDEKRMKSAST